jgi:hypothetical protein
MSILRRHPAYGVAAKLHKAGIIEVVIGIREDYPPVGELRRRVVRAFVLTDTDAFVVGEDRYRNLLRPSQLSDPRISEAQRYNVLGQALQAAYIFGKKGINTLSIDGRPVDEIERELGIVRHGKERC